MLHDVIVIGGSYSGLTAAMQLARARRKVLIVDSGLPRNRFAPRSHGFFGQDGRPPLEMIAEARNQLLAYPTVQFVAGQVVSIARHEAFVIGLADGAEMTARRLILATGVTDDLPDIPGLAPRWGQSVLHCPYCHGFEVAGKPLGVLATGPMSAHQGLLIPDWGPVTYFTQGVYEPAEVDLASLHARGVTIERTRVVEVLSTDIALEAVRLADGRTLPLAALFVAPKIRANGDLAQQLGCDFKETPVGRFIQVDAMNATSVPGVFAAGDVVSPMGNATTASASGVMAGAAAHRSLLM